MTLLNIFHSGIIWVFPFICYGAAIYLFMQAYKASKSGSVTGGGGGFPRVESDQNVSMFKTWPFYWGVGLVIVGTVILIMIATDYKGV